MQVFRLAAALILAPGLMAEEPTATTAPLPDAAPALTQVRRVFVDRFTGGQSAAQMRDLVIASLQGSKLFVVTENEERADAFLRGAAEDLVFTELHQTQDNISVRLNSGRGRAVTTTNNRTGRDTDSAGLSLGENESSRIQERKHEAFATVRLVARNGDVIWSTTQESMGAKFRGASADVADKITRQLVLDMTRARRAPANPVAGEKPQQ